MKVWSAIILGGAVTFLLRFSMLWLFGKVEIPSMVRRALRYIPAAALSALVFPAFFYQNDAFSVGLDNERFWAGMLAAVVAWYSRNIVLTIGSGMLMLYLFRWIWP